MKRIYIFVLGEMLFNDDLIIINSIRNIVLVHDYENWVEDKRNEVNKTREGCVFLGSFNKTATKNKKDFIRFRNTDVQLDLIERFFNDTNLGLSEIELFADASPKLVEVMDKYCNT